MKRVVVTGVGAITPVCINIAINSEKTTRETTSWITFRCQSENGPPKPSLPMRLAGT